MGGVGESAVVSCGRKEAEGMASNSVKSRGETLERGSEPRALPIMVDPTSLHGASAESPRRHLLFRLSDVSEPH
jgi:hypothetical protein